MRDPMTQTSSVLQTTPTYQHQYLETKNVWRTTCLDQSSTSSTKRTSTWSSTSRSTRSSCSQPAKYSRSSTSWYQQKSIPRWRWGRLLLMAEFAGTINAASNNHSIHRKWTYWVEYTSFKENCIWVCSQQCMLVAPFRDACQMPDFNTDKRAFFQEAFYSIIYFSI